MRTEGMFSGATMEDVESDYDQGDGSGVIPASKERLNMLFTERRKKREEYVRESEAVVFRFH